MVRTLGLAISLLPLNAIALQGFQDGREMGQLHQNDAANILLNTDETQLKNMFDSYSNNPPVSHYYEEGKSNKLKEDAINKAQDDENAKVVIEAENNKAKVDKNNLNSLVNKGKLIEKNATEILKDFSSDFVDCTKPKLCKTNFEEKTCFYSPKEILNYCQQTLQIDVIPHDNVTHYPISISISTREHGYAGANIDLSSGIVAWQGPKDANFIVNGQFPINIPCQSVTGSINNLRSINPTTGIDTLSYPNCTNHKMDIHVTGRGRVMMSFNVDLAVHNFTNEFVDRWVNGCLSFENLLHCQKKNEYCVIQNETHDIEGNKIQRPCWQKELAYFCSNKENKEGSRENSCEPYVKAGCEQISSICQDSADDGCKKYFQTYRCPKEECIDSSIVCNPQSYCLNGDCSNLQRKPDPDFGESISKLSAAFEATKSFDRATVFKGEAKECNKYALNAANCCADKGWLLENTSLVKCGKEAIDLGKAREEGRAHYIGHYAENSVGGVCLKDVQVYCIFPSKLARIVQEQGRNKQLNIGFGDAKNPDCGGILPENLQRIDFGQIDFQEFVLDIEKKKTIPDSTDANQKIQEKLSQMTKEGNLHEPS